MKIQEPTSTSKSGEEKLRRAIRQLENVETLLSSLPRFIRKPKKALFRKLEDQVSDTASELEKILKELKKI